jgi:hypothetical protein
MNIRYVKKEDGTIVLQQKNMGTLKWENVPTLEPDVISARDQLDQAFSKYRSKANGRIRPDFILISSKFHTRLCIEFSEFTSRYTQINQFNGMQLIICENLEEDIRFAERIYL